DATGAARPGVRQLSVVGRCGRGPHRRGRRGPHRAGRDAAPSPPGAARGAPGALVAGAAGAEPPLHLRPRTPARAAERGGRRRGCGHGGRAAATARGAGRGM
ncbi:MAG: hypothetical protein AVDCRST_MAG08-1721, partial [uncultured Acetobacteraceae bacterium]